MYIIIEGIFLSGQKYCKMANEGEGCEWYQSIGLSDQSFVIHVTVGAWTSDPLHRRRELYRKSYLDSLLLHGYSKIPLGAQWTAATGLPKCMCIHELY